MKNALDSRPNGRRVSRGRFRVVGCGAFRLDFDGGLGVPWPRQAGAGRGPGQVFPGQLAHPRAACAPSFEALNAGLEERCRARQNERAGRHEQTIGGRLVADRAVLRPLPEAPFEPCDKRPAKVSSTALVRYRMNDYSVPTAYGLFQGVSWFMA